MEMFNLLPFFLRLCTLSMIILALLTACDSTNLPGSAETDREALIALYYAANGESWKHKWESGAPMDEWHGVTTDNNGRVVEIKLNFNQLSGEIPPELGNLAGLTVLDLGNNRLNGGIPPELSKLNNLESQR